MRSYWLKIAGGAVGIFLVGMILIHGFGLARNRIRHTINSDEPIPIPLIGLVPFRLDSQRLGSLKRVELLRSDPEHISGVRVLVKLADSVEPSRLAHCALALDDVENMNERTTFRCQDTSGAFTGLEPFGTIVIKDGSDTFPLLLPSKAVADLRQTSFRLTRHGFEVKSPGDAMAEAMAARTDSMREALDNRIEARSDSVDSLKDLASSLEDSSLEVSAVERRKLQHQADSVRAVMRAMVVRLKSDEARRQALDQVRGLTAAERDSLAQLGPMIADSVRRAVARELGRAQQELEAAGVGGRGAVPPPPTAVEAPVPPAPRKPR